MANPESGKQRAGRIPLNYFRKPNRLERWKNRLAVGALVVAVAWPLLRFVRRNEGRTDYMRGPVAQAHAFIEADCHRCHVPFTPISGPSLAKDVFGSSHSSSVKCRECHMKDGGPHHTSQDREPACASCHRDHQGRNFSLVRVPDSDCTQCHANLHPNPNKFANVTRFAQGSHPDFRSVKSDTGKLKFNHALHMAAGMNGSKWTLRKLGEEHRERYAGEKPKGKDGSWTEEQLNKPIQLSCTSCHASDPADLGLKRGDLTGLPEAALMPERRGGAYMLPITYENQCKACHPLTVPSNTDDPKSPRLEVPHRLQPFPLHEYLRGLYTRQFVDLEKHPGLLEQFVPTRPLPGKFPAAVERKTARDLIDTQVLNAEKVLFKEGKQTCSECHYYEGRVSAAGALKSGVAPRDLTIVPGEVPSVWFKHARFDHAAHRALDCRECHQKADTSTSSKEVLIPGMDNCLQCHAPRTGSGAQARGGARFDCVECHRYHHGDQPLHGLGSIHRGLGGKQGMTVQEFLGGR
ncbi:MAG: cytochrome c3 family protein [Gemmataceae bacterium]|nr:cytochrome c3 family protein [Gemmataceae bacterium]